MDTRNTFLEKSNTLDYKRYVYACMEYKWRLVFISLLISVLTAFVVMQIKPTYESTATLLIEPEQKSMMSVDEMYGFNNTKREFYSTQFEILQSKYIAEAVIDKLNLIEHPEFKGEVGVLSGIKTYIYSLVGTKGKDAALEHEYKMAQLVSDFRQRLSVRPVRGTQLVHITYQAADRKLAAAVANAIGEVYIETQLEAKMGITRKASAWMSEKMAGLTSELERSEIAFESFRQKNNIVDIESAVVRIDNELEKTQETLSIAESDKNKVDSILDLINKMGQSDFESLKSLPEIISHSSISKGRAELESAQLKFAELGKKYGPKHPRMIAATEELEMRVEQVNSQIKSLISGIKKESYTAAQRVNRYRAELAEIRNKYSEITKLDTQYTALKIELDTNRNLYNTFLERSRETEATSDYKASPARFTGMADASLYPVKPNRKLIVAASFVISLMFFVGLVILFEMLDDTIKSPADIESKLSMRMLGMIPLSKSGELDVRAFFDKEQKQFSEAVRTLRTGVVLSQMDADNNKVIEVTSSIPGEGKTTTSINLAFSLGQIENVLLIDADMRKPSICKRFDIPAYHPGLSNFIVGTEKLENCLYQDEQSGIDVMPCGQLPPNPLELLSSNKFNQVIESLKNRYDRIIIDTAPVQAVSDSLMISKSADSVIYVVKSDDTHISMVKNGIGRLLQDKAKLAGVVLNHVDTDKVSKSQGYHGYYDYYSYGDKTS
ncbi:polysaccharide biosynthesis tyrosine autokinase [Pseudoalteromonas neustonica]|uniref:non-specific protein-tyrosine kinase n=1 Tax=Pseudoalteromonas neustonica TaxID=1840331 RepID=A0ABU9U0D4_9GAMM|nr:polysaccharide biosynthesis tyrosine autokinase [Pseudoalteromonas sp. NEC-BIFX-2020_015]NMR23965.1 polysaccharide biosynthesis tyrosine autokinase [Pseudoalteromonas sp. NEC-BIFX-2020_015]